MLCGLPGVGKTALAKEIAPLINAEVLSSDKIRKEIFPKPTYSKEEKKLVYEILMLITRYLHKAGKNCILDATFNRESFRRKLKSKLLIPKNKFYLIECVCPENIVISRLKKRKRDYSDADYSVYKKMKGVYEPVKDKHITIDTSRSTKAVAQIVARKILKK